MVLSRSVHIIYVCICIYTGVQYAIGVTGAV